MILLSGTDVGGFKVDFFAGDEPASIASTGEIRPAPAPDAGSWQTYSFRVAIPADADGIKIVPLAGFGSEVGFDNIAYNAEPVPLPPIPNGDFENGPAGWVEIGSDTRWDYPFAGGNPGAFGVMEHGGEPGTFAIWVASGNNILTLDSLGIQAGTTVRFTQDMILLEGTQIGGLKIEYYTGADLIGETETRPDPVGDGTAWATYTFPFDIPAAADGIKLVPLWGPGSTVGYDNITFSLPSTVPFAAAVERGTVVGWNPTNPDYAYQAQSSEDGTNWQDLGPLNQGTATDSVFTQATAPFYRVVESELQLLEDATNGGFEDPDFDNPTRPEFWDITETSQPATRTTDDARTGVASLRLAVDNGGVATPNKAEAQQQLRNTIGGIIPDNSYDLRFWAKQVSSGVSYVQRFSLRWFDADNVEISEGNINFQPFQGGDGEWVETTALGLQAPEGAVNAQIQLFAETGAVGDPEARGEVLIDDVSFTTSFAFVVNENLPTTTAPGVQVSWPTTPGKTYQPASSSDLETFTDLGSPVVGDGSRQAVSEAISGGTKVYRVTESD